MGSGIDYFGGVASVLMKMGEAFSGGTQKTVTFTGDCCDLAPCPGWAGPFWPVS